MSLGRAFQFQEASEHDEVEETNNWFVNKASKKEEIGTMMSEMIASKETQKSLWSPWFLFKTLVLP